MSSKLEASKVSVEYYIARTGERFLAIDDINLRVNDGEFISLLGPSGCGKTTFLNAIDGLLPWRTVMGNVSYGLELQRVDKQSAQNRSRELIKLVGLSGFEDRFPNELSGGMQQRVNIARALVTNPELLLLDEPFANLDAQTREFMQAELLRIWSTTRKTAIFVTHNITEAIYLSDRVVVFTARPGRIKSIVPIDLPRPRPLKMKRQVEFLKYEEDIWALIEEEVAKTGLFIRQEQAV